ncbi:hypothetical protein P7H14_16455 [Paenibacillus larvae]|nr:hypothetical protein [Paenibacillus larvae]MDT2193437.1 hypothetical protein [Paenibacillus larvae]
MSRMAIATITPVLNRSQRAEKELFIAQIQNQERSQGEDFEYITCLYNEKESIPLSDFTPNHCEI